jgi:hypothetical protein
MFKNALVIVIGLISFNGFSQTKLILTNLTRTLAGIEISKPINIGNNKGYDNQPYFYDMGRSILFSTKVDSINDTIKTDIYKYDINTKKKTAITKNDENEFSPILTTDKQHITCVKGKEQRLAIYDLNGKNEGTLFVHPDSIGYYNWLDENRIAAMVLTVPPSLQIINIKTKQTTVVAQHIGRTIIPFKDGFLFVKENYNDKGKNYILYADKNMRQIPMLDLAKGKEDFCYMNDTLFTVENDTLKFTDVRTERKWEFAADLQKLGMKNITRIATNDRGDKMAFVAKEFIATIAPEPNDNKASDNIQKSIKINIKKQKQ